jgi:streptogramin lyase
MTRFCFGTALFAFMLVTCPAGAAENITAEQLVVQARVHRLAHAMEFGFDSLWLTAHCGATLVRVESTTNQITEIRIHRISTPQTMAIDEAAVWILDAKKKTIFSIDPTDYSVMKEIRVPMLSSEGSMGVGAGAVWVITAEEFDKTLTRFNAHTGVAEAKISLPSGSSSVVVDYGHVWVTGYARGELYRIDPRTNTVTATTKLRATPRFLASGEGSIWVFNQGDSSIQRINGRTGELIATIATGLPPGSGSIATGGGYVWVSMRDAPLSQIDPKTNKLVRTYIGGHGIGGHIRYGAGSLWISGGRISRLRPPNY